MQGIAGVVVGLLLFAVGLGGLGYAVNQMMTHADPDTTLKTIAGLGTFVVASLAYLRLIN